MFKNEFQGGAFFEIFSAQGKDPTANWKLSGGHGIRKIYDKEVKSFVYTIEGSSHSTKMQLPKDPKQSLTLVQRYVVIQINVQKGTDVTIELGVSDLGNNKRRLHFSTSLKENSCTPLHAKVPLTILKRSVWVNLCFDMVSLVGEMWRGQTYKSTESIIVSANCRIRRLFTMKYQPPDSTDDDDIYSCPNTNNTELDSIPRQCQIAQDVAQFIQVINMTKIRCVEWVLSGRDPNTRPVSSTDVDLNASGRRSEADAYHIAFGSKVASKAPPSAQRKTGSAGGKDGGQTSRTSRSSHSRNKLEDGHKVDKLVLQTSRGRERMPSDPGTNIEDDPETTVDKSTLRESRTWSSGVIDVNDETPFKKPHPPARQRSSDQKARRRPRVRSGDQRQRSGNSSERETDSSIPSPQKLKTPENSPLRRAASKEMVEMSPPRRLPSLDRKDKNSLRKNSMELGPEFKSPARHSLSFDQKEFSSKDNAVLSLAELRSQRSRSPEHLKPGSQSLSLNQTKPEKLKSEHSKNNNTEKSLNTRDNVNKTDTNSKTDSEIQDGGNPDESISDVIQALKNKIDLDYDDLDIPEDDGDLSFESEDEMDENIYTFSSPPKPAHKSVRESPAFRDDLDVTQDDEPSLSKSNTARRNLKLDRGAKLESDFIHSSNSSTEDDPHTKILKNSPSPRPPSTGSPRPNSGGRRSRPTSARGVKSIPSIATHSSSPRDTTTSNSNIPGPHVSNNEPTISNAIKSLDSDKNSLNISDQSDGNLNSSLSSPRTSNSRMSISRRSVRELKPDDIQLRKSLEQAKPYDSSKYKSAGMDTRGMEDSFEAAMLASLAREALEEESLDENEGESAGSTNQGDKPNLSKHRYGDDSMSDSSEDDTSFCTERGQVPAMKAHYQDEMRMPSSRLSAGDPLASSNPRDYANIFSPPIVLPSELEKQNLKNKHELSPKNKLISPRKQKSPSDGRMRHRLNSHSDKEHETDGEEELDLLYDPCLNCYFDPRTNKYYELC
ncbi:unnamed protein product [Owenia fusiformis]|uniref:CFA20 domain-containing protein n=1 Tax=Owenia fusiformis TaxID=6347 RepID=A0A8S4NSP0_OWEFU|nr:unnamed protein product [Owenia fusiformis]